MTLTKPIVGQKLYVANIGNSARDVPQVIQEVTVIKVGRKYFTVRRANWHIDTEFHLDDWRERTEYSANYAIYRTAQEWNDEKERSALLRFLREEFSSPSNSVRLRLSTLRQIRDLCVYYPITPHPAAVPA